MGRVEARSELARVGCIEMGRVEIVVAGAACSVLARVSWIQRGRVEALAPTAAHTSNPAQSNLQIIDFIVPGASPVTRRTR
jgi:hypothetical protein